MCPRRIPVCQTKTRLKQEDLKLLCEPFGFATASPCDVAAVRRAMGNTLCDIPHRPHMTRQGPRKKKSNHVRRQRSHTPPWSAAAFPQRFIFTVCLNLHFCYGQAKLFAHVSSHLQQCVTCHECRANPPSPQQPPPPRTEKKRSPPLLSSTGGGSASVWSATNGGEGREPSVAADS